MGSPELLGEIGRSLRFAREDLDAAEAFAAMAAMTDARRAAGQARGVYESVLADLVPRGIQPDKKG